ncbi:MAG: biopolymer transporter ExbD [Lentisphaeraceae bacterium]|nr:biopolymer transporter ExbD [Lentisphaeraceae bacterium]
MNFKKNLGDTQSSFQLAPMVDVMFLLLIFFMVSSIYYQLEKNLEVKAPKAESGTDVNRASVELIINIDKKGAYFINNIKMDISGVKEVLNDVVNKFNQAQPIIIRCDKETPHKFFVRVFDICQALEIDDVRIASEPKQLPEKK